MTAPNVLPSKPQERADGKMISQRDRRWTDTFFDDFIHPRFPNGRPFTGEREFKSGVSEQSITAGFLTADLQCGEYFCENLEQGQSPQERMQTLASAWTAPWFLPGGKKYMNFNYARKRITWRIEAFIADETAGLARYWDAAAKLAGEGEDIDPRRPKAVPFRIRRLLGTPEVYTNKIRLARACQAGDPWIMGAVETPNEELAKLLGLEVQYLGAPIDFGDADYVAAPRRAEPEPLVKPEVVLSLTPAQVQQMIEDALAADAAKRKEQGQRLKDAKAAKKAGAAA